MGLGYWKFMSLALEYHRFSTEVVRYHITLNFLSAQTEELKKCGYKLFLDFLFIIHVSVIKQFSMGRIHENQHCQK